ncbi:MAG: PTS sugar transporter subunit IIA [Lactovum sp.]
MIEEIKRKQEQIVLKDHLDSMICSDLFFIDEKIKTRKEAIDMLCQKLEKFNYSEKDYIYHVLKREDLSSTAFGNVAIPHSIKMIGKKTGMAVLINPNGINWGDGRVNIVLLLCIHPKDKKIFHEFFDNISDILTGELAVRNLMNVTNYKDFKKKILMYM